MILSAPCVIKCHTERQAQDVLIALPKGAATQTGKTVRLLRDVEMTFGPVFFRPPASPASPASLHPASSSK